MSDDNQAPVVSIMRGLTMAGYTPPDPRDALIEKLISELGRERELIDELCAALRWARDACADEMVRRGECDEDYEFPMGLVLNAIKATLDMAGRNNDA